MRSVLLSLILALLAGAAVFAETYLVLPDGTGDFSTIQEAIDASSGGDVIELADGAFRGPGNRDLDYHGKTITVRSESGSPESCIIDCEGSDDDPHRGFLFQTSEGPSSILERVTVTNGHVSVITDSRGGAISCYHASPTLTECVFVANFARLDGGGVRSHGGSPIVVGCVFDGNVVESGTGGGMHLSGGQPVVVDCVFRANVSEHGDGGGLHSHGSQARVTGCEFAQNEALEGGALACWSDDARVTGCLFRENVPDGGGGAVLCSGGTTQFALCTFVGNCAIAGAGMKCVQSAEILVRNCTLYGNTGWAGAGAVEVRSGAHVTIDNTIIAFSTDGWAVRCDLTGSATLTCCDLYANADGDWAYCIEDQFGTNGNISADPRFCNPAAGDFTLNCDSPCAPAGTAGCDLIGAWPVGCGASPADRVTWGGLKALFRQR